MKKLRICLLIGIGALVLMVGMILLTRSNPKGDGAKLPEVSEFQRTETSVSPPARPIHRERNESARLVERSSRNSIRQNWLKFQERFGRQLIPEFAADGRFVSARGQPGEGIPGPHDFSPQDAQQAVVRARQIIEAAVHLLEIRPECPLANPITRNGSLSAQIFFSETYRGLPVAPVGGVKVDLGPRGELLGLYSNYVPSLNLMNRADLTLDQAREKIPSQYLNRNEPSLGHSAEGGSQVIWVSGGNLGRIAYQFSAGGHEVIVDAESGKILFTRDQRNY